MMRNLLFVMVSTLFLLTACEAAQPDAGSQTIQKVPRIVYEIYPDEWYHTQANLWEKEIQKDSQNPGAWYNYYNANRYARFEDIDSKERQEKLDKIISEMGQAIPNSYEYNLLKYWTKCDVTDIEPALETYNIDPDRPDTYYTFLSYYTLTGDKKNLKKFAKKLYDSQDIEPWLYYYNYNVLMSLEPNAVLITNGDNDTYPIWVLQQVKNIRRDVTVLNLSLSAVEDYFKNTVGIKYKKIDYQRIKAKTKSETANNKPLFRSHFIQQVVREISMNYQDVPVYFALTVYCQNTEPFKEDLYLTGLAYKYNSDRFDNLAYLKRNLENYFLLDYLDFGLYHEKRFGKNLSVRVERNYIPGMIMLAEHYRNSEQKQQAQRWIDLAFKVAESSEFEEAIEEIKRKFK